VLDWTQAEEIERRSAAGTLHEVPTLHKVDHAA
jgi:hypothetical protein